MAISSPPTASIAVAISMALREVVPLNSRCSRKCDEPASRSSSSREPTPTQMPRVAERTPGIVSVSTRRPPGSTVRSTRPPTSSTSITRVTPAGAGADARSVDPTPAPAPVGVGSATVSGLRGSGGLGVGRRGGLAGAVTLGSHRDEADLAAGVDVGDLDLQLVADVDDVLDLADPLAATQLADVDQAVLAREQGHEGAERRRLDDGAEEALPDLGHLRVGDRVD